MFAQPEESKRQKERSGTSIITLSAIIIIIVVLMKVMIREWIMSMKMIFSNNIAVASNSSSFSSRNDLQLQAFTFALLIC